MSKRPVAYSTGNSVTSVTLNAYDNLFQQKFSISGSTVTIGPKDATISAVKGAMETAMPLVGITCVKGSTRVYQMF